MTPVVRSIARVARLMSLSAFDAGKRARVVVVPAVVADREAERGDRAPRGRVPEHGTTDREERRRRLLRHEDRDDLAQVGEVPAVVERERHELGRPRAVVPDREPVGRGDRAVGDDGGPAGGRATGGWAACCSRATAVHPRRPRARRRDHRTNPAYRPPRQGSVTGSRRRRPARRGPPRSRRGARSCRAMPRRGPRTRRWDEEPLKEGGYLCGRTAKGEGGQGCPWIMNGSSAPESRQPMTRSHQDAPFAAGGAMGQ